MMNATAAPDVLGTIATPNEDLRATIKSKYSPPPVTTSSSEEYIEACARSNEKASRLDPLTTLFQAEKLPPHPNESTFIDENGLSRPTYSALQNRLARVPQDKIETLVYESGIGRIRSKAHMGAFVAEAGNWAATTTWEPLFAPPPPTNFDLVSDFGSRNLGAHAVSAHGNSSEPWLEVMQSLMLREQELSDLYPQKPVFAEFITRIEIARRKHLYPLLWKAQHANVPYENPEEHTKRALAMGTKEQSHLLFWHLCLTSRNPAVQPPVPGAVRAIIEPFVKKWVDELGMPAVWLEAGSARARDVYSYLGFRVVDEIVVGEDGNGNGVKTWCMVYTKD